MDVRRLTEQRFASPEEAIKAYGSERIMLGCFPVLQLRANNFCTLKDDLIVPQVPPIKPTMIEFRLTQMYDGVDYWWQYFRHV